jgi:biotin operon repressor
MLFPSALHRQLQDGTITVAFRRWRRPTVRTGGTLRYPCGVLAIDEVAPIEPADITPADARAAGASGPDEVIERLGSGEQGQLYRIRFHHLGADPRERLRHDVDMDDRELAALRERLARMDARSRRDPWTLPTLRLLAERPGVAAGELAEELGAERDAFKRDVRKLKELGLTVSLSVGYELSPRGRAFLDDEAAR